MIDREKTSQLYDRYSRQLYIYIYGFVRSSETAEDLLHDTFVRFIEYSAKRAIDEANLKSLLYTIARNICIDYQRKSGKILFVALDDGLQELMAEDASDEIGLRETNRIVNAVIQKSDHVTRSVFIMKNDMQMTYRDIGESLGISERTAKRKMSAILTRIADALRENGLLAALLFFWH